VIVAYTASEPTPLVGTRWALTGYDNGTGGFSSVIRGTEITATFAQEGAVTGSAGCNSYNGAYEAEDATSPAGSISIGPVASTMMACPAPEGIMEQETAYLAALQSATAYEIQGDELTLTGAEGQRLATYTVSEGTPLIGTLWEAIQYNNGKEAVVSLVIGTEITAIFGEDGSLSGTAGCNNYTTSYQVEGDSISIGPAATTRKFCAEPEGTMEQETLYLAALEQAATYRIDGDRLELRDAGGALQASYVASAVAAAGAEGSGLDEGSLKNMEYKSGWTQSGTALLTDGEYREQAAPGSATETVVQITPYVAYGQLNGQEAAAVILVTDPGGSGTFYDLAVVVEQDGQPVNIATTSLGDRVQVNSLVIAGNEIVVDMITQGPEDPMCCPTQNVVKTYALQGDQLVETSSQVMGSSGGEDSSLVGVVWKWEQFLESNDETLTTDDPDKYTLEFTPEGTVRIKADCNSATGAYEVSGSQLTIGVQAVTMAMCPPDSLSDQYLKLLGEVVSYVLEGGKLYLSLRMDAGIMSFTQ
jgi:heat shock protein HslJ